VLKKDKQPSHVQSVERAIQIIELLARENREVSLTEIAQRLEWPKTTVYGLISTLRDYHYVDQSPATGKYGLGLRIFELGRLAVRVFDVRAVAMPLMQQFHWKFDETVQLATESQGEVLYMEKIDSTRPLHIVSEAGLRLPMHCSGLGKVLLAYKEPADVKHILAVKGMAKMTRRTITEPLRLEQELLNVRRQGYAVDDREIMDSMRCVAAPIFSREGEVHYAVSVSGLADALTGDYLQRLIFNLLALSAEISRGLGYKSKSEIS
jgi:DNA-binding IclR family transcriptional regulator